MPNGIERTLRLSSVIGMLMFYRMMLDLFIISGKGKLGIHIQNEGLKKKKI